MLDKRKDYMYLRLSKEDGDVENGTIEESNSIASQRLCIWQYLKEQDEFVENFEEIIDDGYSGTNMSRPGIQHLLELMKNGMVRTLIVRDLSRFARNYLDAGRFLEFIFPEYGVRFISINDQYDSKVYGESTGGLEFAIRNLINQMYSHDISKKIKSAVDMKKRAGEFVYGTAPYGYKKGSNKNTILVDPVVAPVVQNIFQWAASGMTITEIARKLNDDSVTTPSVYLAPVRGKYKTRPFWTYESVRNILRNRIYTGDTVPFKSHVIRVGSDHVRQIPEELQEIIPCTHEPLISRELYNRAIQVIKSNKKSKKNKETYLFTSRLVCGCCGNHLVKGKATNKVWRCTNGRYIRNLDCDKVLIRDDVINGIVLNAIRKLCLLTDEKITSVCKETIGTRTEQQTVSDALSQLKLQLSRLQNKKMEEYERYASGQIPVSEFSESKTQIMLQMEKILDIIQKKEQELNMITRAADEQETLMHQMRRISQYKGVSELNPALLKALVKQIVVKPGDKIEIIWNFSDIIGKMIGDVTKSVLEIAI